MIHPFLLSIGVYIISFGLLFALIIGATWYAVDSLKEIDKGKDKIVSAVLPVLPNDFNLVKQSEQVSRLTEQFKKQNKFKDGNIPVKIFDGLLYFYFFIIFRLFRVL